MSETTLTYQEIASQLKKLQAENKRLRLRPSLNSTDANILEFMDIKRDLAQATLDANNLNDTMTICTRYIKKITNIHSVSFFTSKPNSSHIDVVDQVGLPKKIIKDLASDHFFDKYYHFLFPPKNAVYFIENIKKSSQIPSDILKLLSKYKTIFVLPVLHNTEINISVLLLSQKAFENNRFIQVLYQSIQAQLSSSFTRIIMTEVLKYQTLDLEKSIKARTQSFEIMNKELMKQVQTHRQKEQKISEELDLFKSIILQQKDIVLRINTEGQILYSNPQFQSVKMVNDGLKGNLINYFGNGDFPGLEFINWDFERDIQRVNCEIQLSIPTTEWFNFNFYPIKNKRGMITEIQIVARNINRIKKLENRLRYQKGMLLNMLNTSEKISFTINKQYLVEFISDNWEKYTGHSSTKTINHKLIDFAHPDDLQHIDSKLAPLYANSTDTCSFTCKLQYADKTWHSQKADFFSIRNTEGEVLYFVGSLIPVD